MVLLRFWLGKKESSAFWMSVLTDMKALGVEEFLVTATDNLNGFTDTIRNVFFKATIQIYVVHQIQNTFRYVVWKDKKVFSKDMNLIYDASTKDATWAALDDFVGKCENKH